MFKKRHKSKPICTLENKLTEKLILNNYDYISIGLVIGILINKINDE